ncbi:hypoxanthine phosphoribosyltransferase [Candidatus Woesearchaeota archaeon]|nr:hypoxanthine phosphoribosyltransferase [Candidatus Woesearchaeota archaeon]
MKIKKLIPEVKIKKKIKHLAIAVKRDFGNNVRCIVVLDGAQNFFSVLEKELEKLGMTVKSSFIRIKSYKGKRSSGRLDAESIPEIKEQNLLIVDDILDTGLTLSYLRKKFPGARACVLLDKRVKKDARADYVGFKIPDKFVVGFGLDYEEKYRELGYIGYIE